MKEANEPHPKSPERAIYTSPGKRACCPTRLVDVMEGLELARRAVAPGRPDLRAGKEGVWDANVESSRRMILDVFAPIARRWPRDGAALLTAPPIPRGCVEQRGQSLGEVDHSVINPEDKEIL